MDASVRLDTGVPLDGAMPKHDGSLPQGELDATANRDAAVLDAGPDVMLDPTASDLTRSGFTAYGKLVLAFHRAVDASTLSVRFAPARPSTLEATAITQLEPDVVEVKLSTYHLPLAYVVTVRTPDFKTKFALDGHNGSRAAFLTQARGPGDLRSWPTAKGAASARAAANQICQAEADAAGLVGTFRAFVSSDESADTYDAVCNVLGLSGKWSAFCGKPNQPIDETPIISLGGLPIALGVSAIAQHLWLTPVRYTTAFTEPVDGAFTWTGSNDAGRAGSYDCKGWTSSQSTEKAMLAASMEQQLYKYSHVLDCDGSDGIHRLLCIQSGGDFFPASDLHVRTGKEVFVTTGNYAIPLTYTPSAGATLQGAAAGDALCQQEAAGAGFSSPEQFVAWLSTSTDDAICRLAASGGKRGAYCGLGSWPARGPWVRHDGFVVAESLAQLVSGKLTAPVLFGPSGARGALDQAWTGTGEDGALAYANCSDFSDAKSTGTGGNTTSVGRTWTFYFGGSCSTLSRPLLCFRR